MKKKVGIIKQVLCIVLVFLLSINSFAAIVSDNDGSAFITKSEFDALKSSFQSQIDSYNNSIDSKIDGAIASYLTGIQLTTDEDVRFLVSDSTAVKFVDNFRFPRRKAKRNGSTAAVGNNWSWVENGSLVADYYGTETYYPWGQAMYYNWTKGLDCRTPDASGNRDFFPDSARGQWVVLWEQQLYALGVTNSGLGGSVAIPCWLWTIDLKPKDDSFDYKNNKIYKNLCAVGKKDGALFYPTNAYGGVSCRLLSGGSMQEILPVVSDNGNGSWTWSILSDGMDGKLSPKDESAYAVSMVVDFKYTNPNNRRQFTWHWTGDNYKLYQQAINITNHQDKTQYSEWECGYGGTDISNSLCVVDKALYVSCVGGTSQPRYSKYSNGSATLDILDSWFQHSHKPTGATDYQFGTGVTDTRKYYIDNVRVGGYGLDDVKVMANLTWDNTTELNISCPNPLMNCKIRDLGSTKLRDNDGLAVKIGDGLPVCTLEKKGTLTLKFKVNVSDSNNVKLSFKYNGFQDTGDYLKDDSGTLWKDKTIAPGTYTIKYPIEEINKTIYCGIKNNDSTGVRYSTIQLISGTITYES